MLRSKKRQLDNRDSSDSSDGGGGSRKRRCLQYRRGGVGREEVDHTEPDREGIKEPEIDMDREGSKEAENISEPESTDVISGVEGVSEVQDASLGVLFIFFDVQ
jgi:hypothetical protein